MGGERGKEEKILRDIWAVEKKKEDVRKSNKAQISIMDSMQKWAFNSKIRIQLPRRKSSLHPDRADPSCTCKRRVGKRKWRKKKKKKKIQLFSDLAFTFLDLTKGSVVILEFGYWIQVLLVRVKYEHLNIFIEVIKLWLIRHVYINYTDFGMR